MSGTRSTCLKAPATDPRRAAASLLICGYGSAEGEAGLARRRARLAATGGFAETAACSLFGTPPLEEAVAALAGDPLLLVPLLVSEGFTHGILRERLARLGGAREVVLCPALGSHPGLAREIAAWTRREIARRGWSGDDTALLLVGHGTRRDPASRRAVGRIAGAVEAGGGFREVATAFLEERPWIAEAVRPLAAERIVAVGCFAEAGRHASRDVPERLARSGRETVYLGPLGAADFTDKLILDLADKGLADLERRRRTERPNRAERGGGHADRDSAAA